MEAAVHDDELDAIRQFIAHAWDDIPRLLDEIDRLRAELATRI
jgi:hypothetical protein